MTEPGQERRDSDGPAGPSTSVGWPGDGPVGAPVRPAPEPSAASGPPREPDEPRPAADPAAAMPAPPPMPPGPPVRPPDPAPGRSGVGQTPGGGVSAPPPAPARAPAAPAATQQLRTTAPPRPVSTPLTAGTAPVRKGGRRARLTLKRIDPWSTLKFAFVYSLAGLVVLLVAVVALYAVVDAMGVIDSIRSFLNDVDQPKSGQGIAVWLSFGRVLTVAIVIGVVNVILFTAFATLTAFVYNVCTEIVGGIEVTLAERS